MPTTRLRTGEAVSLPFLLYPPGLPTGVRTNGAGFDIISLKGQKHHIKIRQFRTTLILEWINLINHSFFF